MSGGLAVLPSGVATETPGGALAPGMLAMLPLPPPWPSELPSRSITRSTISAMRSSFMAPAAPVGRDCEPYGGRGERFMAGRQSLT
jgi:hypothetical protein